MAGSDLAPSSVFVTDDGQWSQNTAEAAAATTAAECMDVVGGKLETSIAQSPVEVDMISDAKSDTDLALDITAELVDEQLDRQHLRPASHEKPVSASDSAAQAWLGTRPPRLEAAVPDEGQISFTGTKHKGLIEAEAIELPAFRHLAALEEAVRSGEALAGNLPELPTALKGDLDPNCQDKQVAHDPNTALMIHSARGMPSPRSRPKHAWDRGSVPLRTCGGGLLAKAAIGMQQAEPRFFFSEEGWGMQPPLLPGARKHTAAPSMGFGCSALRGAPLQQCRRGPHASALWVSTEKARLRTEAVKPFGSSAAIAFIQNGGPRSMEPLQQPLCDQDLV